MSGGADDGAEARRSWIVSLADLLSLMLTFMVMLFAMSDVGPPPTSPSAGAETLAEIVDWPGREVPAFASRFATEGRDPAAALDLDYLGPVLQAMLRREPLLADARIERREDRLLLAIPATLLFATGSARLTDGARHALDALTPTLQGIGNRLGVAGHADPQAIRPGGTFPSNWELSLARAIAVADALTAAGMRRPVTCYGLADTHPDELGEGLGTGGDAIARRVDLVFFASAGDEK